MPRSPSGLIGKPAPRTGTEPSTAQSALRLRLVLAAAFLPLLIAAAVVSAVWAATAGPGDALSRAVVATLAAVCAALAVSAALDLLAVARRLKRERGRTPRQKPPPTAGSG
ncbi:DUF6343 family protein [Streptomyces sp. NBC_00009]|uniref:DUF6343 family protein n=1 Tax=Streptomyces sp. NBC_00009 TaxID=2975620 RepID=UPI003868F4FB